MRQRAAVLLLLVCCAAGVAVSLAYAGTIDRVVVGLQGRNATRGFSPTLYVEVMVESDYKKVDFDGDHGDWIGPPYRSTSNPNLGGRAKAAWTVYFDRGLTVKQAQTKNFTRKWARFQAAAVEVPHVVGRTRVAKIKGQWLLTKAPGDNNTQFEGVLSFPLCGIVVSAEFAFLDPYSVSDNLGGQFRVYPGVGDKDAFSWNRDKAILAPAYVALLGYLPAARIAPAARLKPTGSTTHAVLGVVRDCSGAPMPSVVVRTGKLSARTDERGVFDLRVPTAGDYRVQVTAGGGTVAKTLHAS